MIQTLLEDNRIALLKEKKDGYEVTNLDDIKLKDTLNLGWASKGFYNSKSGFEEEVKKCYRLERVKWID